MCNNRDSTLMTVAGTMKITFFLKAICFNSKFTVEGRATFRISESLCVQENFN